MSWNEQLIRKKFECFLKTGFFQIDFLFVHAYYYNFRAVNGVDEGYRDFSGQRHRPHEG